MLTDNLISYYKLDGDSNDAHGSNNGTDTNVSYSSSYGKINQGASFNGSSSKIQSNFVNYDTITVSCWFKTSYSGSNYDQVLVRKDDSSESGVRYLWSILFNRNSSFLNKITINSYAGGSVYSLDSPNTYNDGNYHHIVAIFNPTGTGLMTLYIDNSLIGSTACASINGGTPKLSIGAYVSTIGGFLSGYIDEVGIWSRALSSTEVGELYNSGAGLSYPFTAGTTIKRWNGTAWEAKPLKRYNGSEWENVTIKRYNGSTWDEL